MKLGLPAFLNGKILPGEAEKLPVTVPVDKVPAYLLA